MPWDVEKMIAYEQLHSDREAVKENRVPLATICILKRDTENVIRQAAEVAYYGMNENN